MSIKSILECLCGSLDTQSNPRPPYPRYLADEKPLLEPPPAYSDNPVRTPAQKAADEQAAAEIVAVLQHTDKTDAALKAELAPVCTAGWSEWLAERIFDALRSTLGDDLDGVGADWAVTLMDAYQMAKTTAEDHFREFLQYAKEHPGEVAAEVVVEIVLSLVTFGILVRMTKWVVRLLGFSELGPVAGSFAARWEARYAGYIPAGSLFSYIQRMGMTWK